MPATDQGFRVQLPYPPSLNNLYATVNGRRVLSRRGRQYKTEVAWLVRRLRAEALPLSGRLSLTLSVYCPDQRRRDLSNLLKIVEDSLQAGGAYLDDSQIDRLLVIRRGIATAGYLLVAVAPLGDHHDPQH